MNHFLKSWCVLVLAILGQAASLDRYQQIQRKGKTRFYSFMGLPLLGSSPGLKDSGIRSSWQKKATKFGLSGKF